MGFFDFLNIETFSLNAGSAKRSRSLIPIEVWSIPQLKAEADEEPVGALVDSRSRELASVLLQKDTGQVYETLQYAIREISRNAIEHSQGEIAVIMAQYWPKSNRAEIVVADDGIGIADNLYDNEYVEVSNNIGALKVALMPGISGVSRRDRGQQDSVWRNSGFGLYVVSRLAARFGSFCIISNGDYLELSRRRQVHQPYPLSGTAVSLNIQINEASDSTFYIRHLIDEGEKTRTAIMNNYPILASEASKMLLSDFDKQK